MFWAQHRDTGRLLVSSWKDDAMVPEQGITVPVERWQKPITETMQGSQGPNNRPWLSRLDDRITGAWEAGDIVGFAWTSGSITSSQAAASYPLPHIRVAMISRTALINGSSSPVKPIAEPHIWSSSLAFAYPAVAPNEAGDVGIGLYFGIPA